MKLQLTGKQAIVLEAIKSEMSSGKSFKEATDSMTQGGTKNIMFTSNIEELVASIFLKSF